MIDGKTLGVWSVKHKSKCSEVTITPFERIDVITKELLSNYIESYQKYLTKEVFVSLVQQIYYVNGMISETPLAQACYALMRQIPRGKVTTYKILAEKL